MCGRYVPPDEAALERFWRVDRRNWAGWVVPRYNVAPTTVVPIILRGKDGAITLVGARWGLIPAWWKQDAPPALTFNARSEEAAQKPVWRQGLRGMRCLMPMRGWYEWNENEPVRGPAGRKVNQPYYISSPSPQAMAFAGLWSVWDKPGAPEPVLSCALLSREAAPGIAAIHHRMPVVLAPEQYAAWLDPQTTPEAVQHMIAHPRTDFAGHPVSLRVNSVRNDGPELIEPQRLSQEAETQVPDGAGGEGVTGSLF